MLGRVLTTMTLGASLMLGGVAVAADFDMANPVAPVADVPATDGWNFNVTPYGWMTSINGTVTAKGRSVSTSASFIDLVENSDKLIPFMGYVEIGKGRFSAFGDIFYADMGFSAEKSGQVDPVPGLEISARGKAALDTKLTIAQAAAAYDIIRKGGTTVSGYAGIRYWRMDAEINLKIKGAVDVEALGLKRKGKYAIARSGETDWVDPLVGFRVRQELTQRDSIQLAADIGGFGVGSDISWQVFGAYTHNWDIGRDTKLGLTLGYRILSVDYSEGKGQNERGIDLALHGPMAGLSLKW